jgi:hypothetical protein
MACSQLSPYINLPLKREILEDILDKAKDWALMHGKKINLNKICVSCPVTITLCMEYVIQTVTRRGSVNALGCVCCPSWYHDM